MAALDDGVEHDRAAALYWMFGDRSVAVEDADESLRPLPQLCGDRVLEEGR